MIFITKIYSHLLPEIKFFAEKFCDDLRIDIVNDDYLFLRIPTDCSFLCFPEPGFSIFSLDSRKSEDFLLHMEAKKVKWKEFLVQFCKYFIMKEMKGKENA